MSQLPACRPGLSAKPAAPNRRALWTRCSTASCWTADAFCIGLALRPSIGHRNGASRRSDALDVQEVRKLDGYLKKLFGNPQIRVVPKGRDNAEIFVGPDDLGELTVDDEDGERSYNFRMVIQVGNDPSIQPVPTLNAYLRSKFDNENIRVVPRPKKTDSLEVYIGEEFIAVLFLEIEKGRRSYILELPILDVDLVD